MGRYKPGKKKPADVLEAALCAIYGHAWSRSGDWDRCWKCGKRRRARK